MSNSSRTSPVRRGVKPSPGKDPGGPLKWIVPNAGLKTTVREIRRMGVAYARRIAGALIATLPKKGRNHKRRQSSKRMTKAERLEQRERRMPTLSPPSVAEDVQPLSHKVYAIYGTGPFDLAPFLYHVDFSRSEQGCASASSRSIDLVGYSHGRGTPVVPLRTPVVTSSIGTQTTKVVRVVSVTANAATQTSFARPVLKYTKEELLALKSPQVSSFAVQWTEQLPILRQAVDICKPHIILQKRKKCVCKDVPKDTGYQIPYIVSKSVSVGVQTTYEISRPPGLNLDDWIASPASAPYGPSVLRGSRRHWGSFDHRVEEAPYYM